MCGAVLVLQPFCRTLEALAAAEIAMNSLKPIDIVTVAAHPVHAVCARATRSDAAMHNGTTKVTMHVDKP